jgi:hypothetical protein
MDVETLYLETLILSVQRSLAQLILSSALFANQMKQKIGRKLMFEVLIVKLMSLITTSSSYY